MTKAFATDELKLRAASGSGGPTILAGQNYPIAAGGIQAPIGSYYSCQTDGSWWQKVRPAATGWVQLRTMAAANGDSVRLENGMPVASSGDMIVRAVASSLALSLSIGVIVAEADPTLVAQVLPVGLAFLGTSEWDAVTGQTGGLTPGAVYFVGSTPGTLTTTPPSSTGQVVAEIGHAVTSTGLLLLPKTPILL